jgi:hypothetical protein
MLPDANPAQMSQGQSLDAAANDADANAGSGNVGDPTVSCPAEPPQDTTIEIRLYNVYHVPIAGAAYTLAVDGSTYEGETDADGMVSHVVPGKPTSGTLTLDMWAVELTIHPLSASDDPDGYAARLDNLGYYAADPSMALMRFQSANDLDPSGQMNDETRAKLEEVHGH